MTRGFCAEAPPPPYPLLTRRLEVNRLVNLFLGKGAKVVYEISVGLYLYGARAFFAPPPLLSGFPHSFVVRLELRQ